MHSLCYTNLSYVLFYNMLPRSGTLKDVLALERVQRRASWLALGQKRGEMDYEDRLRKLKCPSLETRRLFLSLVECYKIVFNMNKLNFDDLSLSVIQPALTIRTSFTVPAKCKLPPLVSFLARRVSFLSRRVSFLSIRVSFLARVTEPFSMEYITRERSLYYLLYQGFPFALCCQIGEVEIKTESLFVFSFIVLNLQRLRTSV